MNAAPLGERRPPGVSVLPKRAFAQTIPRALLAVATFSCSLDSRDLSVSTADERLGPELQPPAAGDAGGSPTGVAEVSPGLSESGNTVNGACPGCSINGICIEAGALDSTEACRVCDPTRNQFGFSANVGARCGAGPIECSGQDTCSPEGTCEPNDLAGGTRCGDGLFCIEGRCAGCGDAALPDAFCASQSEATPFCNRETGACSVCTPASCNAASLVCDDAVGCRPCVDHADCPDSACYLDATSTGRCFEPDEVVEISTTTELITELALVGYSTRRVLRLAPIEFFFEATIATGDGGLVAILGQPGTVITGGGTSPFLSVSVDSSLYLAGVTLADGAGDAINAAPVTGLFVDDVTIRDFGNIGILGSGGLGRIRRSRISAALSAIRWEGEGLAAAGALSVENTAIGPDASIGLQLVDLPRVDLRYVTIAGNDISLQCEGSVVPSGTVRNSILTGTTDLAISGAPCQSLGFSGNAVDQAGFGSLIGHFDSSWFRDAGNSDFHLTEAGALAIGQTASLAVDDPQLDIDGAPRPTGRNGVPGIDEP